MESTVEVFMNNISQVSLWIVVLFFFVSAVLQIIFPPYPGDSVFIFGGYLASTIFVNGYIAVFVPYLAGTLFSSYALYELGYNKGESLLNTKLVKKYFSQAHQLKAESWIIRYGVAALFVCKFVPGVNSMIIIFSGIFRLNRVLAYVGMGIASIIHNVIFFLVGKAIGGNWNNISRFLSIYNRAVLVLLGLGIVVFALVKITTHLRRKDADR